MPAGTSSANIGEQAPIYVFGPLSLKLGQAGYPPLGTCWLTEAAHLLLLTRVGIPAIGEPAYFNALFILPFLLKVAAARLSLSLPGFFAPLGLLGRRTRSGALFSPWEVGPTFEISVDIADFVGPATASDKFEGDEFQDLGADAPYEPLEDHVPFDPVQTSVEGHETRPEAAGALKGLVEAKDSLEIGTLPSRSQRRKDKQRENRRLGRSEKQRLLGTKTKEVARNRMAQARLELVDSDLKNSRRASTGVFGLKPAISCDNKQVLALEKDGFKVIPWSDPSRSFALVDSQGRMFVGGGRPKDTAGWEKLNTDACKALNSAREACSFAAKQVEHQRGNFPVLASGVSYGNGRKRPLNVKNSVRNAAALKSLLESDAMKRVAGLQNQLLHTFSPELGSFYAATLNDLLDHHPELIRNFSFSDFACITVNFGPVTETIDHVDRANLAAGLCAVTALGDFDPKQGGHLVLWDLKLILEFPPGATILLPSALLRHSNTPLNQQGRQRFSVTQYSPGGLFRWVENGFCSNAECDPALNSPAAGKLRWEKGLERFAKTLRTGCTEDSL